MTRLHTPHLCLPGGLHSQGEGLVVSLERAAKAQEMIVAIFAAGLSGSRVTIPLVNRSHPLE